MRNIRDRRRGVGEERIEFGGRASEYASRLLSKVNGKDREKSVGKRILDNQLKGLLPEQSIIFSSNDHH